MNEIRFYHCMMCKRVYDGGWGGLSMTRQEFKEQYEDRFYPTSGICEDTSCKRKYKEYERDIERQIKELRRSL